MTAKRTHRRRAAGAGLSIGALAVALAGVTAAPAVAAVPPITATFNLGALTVIGDAGNNVITVSRDAAGSILLNAGAVSIAGGPATVANTRSINVVGAAGNDRITVDESSGALPRAFLIGGGGNDALTGGSGDDILVGQAGTDTLLGKGGIDTLLGGADNDSLTGGDANDQVSGEDGRDTLVWNPGDDSDVNEGGAGQDTTLVLGGNGDEQFTAVPNGTRVQFARIAPAPFTIDIGSVEVLALAANGGADSFTGSNGLAATLIMPLVDGGPGNDTILGSDANEVLFGGSGNDFVDGNRGNDVAVLGTEDDTFQWDPGDGSDTVEGQAGIDTMRFNGSNGIENFDVAALGSNDNITVNDLSGTDVTHLTADLTGIGGTNDGAADNVIVNATNGSDVVVVGGQGASLEVAGLHAAISIAGVEPANDALTVNALAGDDVVDASGVAADSMALILNGDGGDDVVIGGDGNDTLTGGDNDDVLIGGPGLDALNGGAGDDTFIGAEIVVDGLVVGPEWLAAHAQLVNGATVLAFDGRHVTLPAADLVPATATSLAR